MSSISKAPENEIPIHNSLRILLINSENELLLMCADDPHTTSKEGKYHGRFWFTIGGEIESNETLLETATRELKEETGIDPAHVTFGPVVWFGEFDLVLSGKLKRLKQQFIVAHTKNAEITLEHLTANEKKVVKKLAWFSLDQIRSHDEIIYPVPLKDYLPDILLGNYPSKPIWIDLGKTPEKKPIDLK